MADGQRIFQRVTHCLRSNLASVRATAATPWTFQGFFPLSRPDSPVIYADAGPSLIGLVYKRADNTWFHHSTTIPFQYTKGSTIVGRQQRSELFAVLQTLRWAISSKMKNPTFVLDSTSSFGAILKGSTCLKDPKRTHILNRIHILITKHQFLGFVNLVNTKHHPADYSSRVFIENSTRVPPVVATKLAHLQSHPGLTTSSVQTLTQDQTRQAWSTPDWLRWYIRKTPAYPPTIDLFADHTSALTAEYYSLAHPFQATCLQREETVAFFQPPYDRMADHWKACVPYLPPSRGFWGLVPTSFYHQAVQKSFPDLHLCSINLQVNYIHPTLPGDRAAFTSTLFYIPHQPSPPTPSHPLLCICGYLKSIPHAHPQAIPV